VFSVSGNSYKNQGTCDEASTDVRRPRWVRGRGNGAISHAQRTRFARPVAPRRAACRFHPCPRGRPCRCRTSARPRRRHGRSKFGGGGRHMSIEPIQDPFRDSIGRIFGTYAGSFAALVVLLAVLEQVGVPDRVIGVVFVLLTIAVYVGIGIASLTVRVSEYYVAG